MNDEQRAWIPPIPLALGAISIAISWILVLAYAANPSFAIALAWIHSLALGGFTTIALSVLTHAISAFTDLQWRWKPVAKGALPIVALGAIGLALSFAFNSGPGVAVFAVVAAMAIITFVIPALATLAQPTLDPTDATIARALSFVVFLLLCTAAIGLALGLSYASGNERILSLAPVHATLGIVGWLTLLTMGVSARTFRPLLGAASRATLPHILSNGGMTLAAVLAPLGLLFSPALFYTACWLGVIAAIAYALDTFDRLFRAGTPHRPVHAMVAMAMLWLVVASIFALRGEGATAIVAALAGWITSMVYAHLHHLAVRVLATIVLGPDDETPPWELLTPALSWTTFTLSQAAAVLLVVGTRAASSQVIYAAGFMGLAALAVYAFNIRRALRVARKLAA
jgi:hypothetical protein